MTGWRRRRGRVLRKKLWLGVLVLALLVLALIGVVLGEGRPRRPLSARAAASLL